MFISSYCLWYFDNGCSIYIESIIFIPMSYAIDRCTALYDPATCKLHGYINSVLYRLYVQYAQFPFINVNGLP